MERVQQILRRMQRKARAGQTVQEAIEDAFRRFDTSHDGQLQFGEFYNALTNMVGSVNHMDANLLFRAIDTNDSGSIAISEFRVALMHPAGYRAFGTHCRARSRGKATARKACRAARGARVDAEA